MHLRFIIRLIRYIALIIKVTYQRVAAMSMVIQVHVHPNDNSKQQVTGKFSSMSQP